MTLNAHYGDAYTTPRGSHSCIVSDYDSIVEV